MFYRAHPFARSVSEALFKTRAVDCFRDRPRLASLLSPLPNRRLTRVLRGLLAATLPTACSVVDVPNRLKRPGQGSVCSSFGSFAGPIIPLSRPLTLRSSYASSGYTLVSIQAHRSLSLRHLCNGHCPLTHWSSSWDDLRLCLLSLQGRPFACMLRNAPDICPHARTSSPVSAPSRHSFPPTAIGLPSDVSWAHISSFLGSTEGFLLLTI